MRKLYYLCVLLYCVFMQCGVTMAQSAETVSPIRYTINGKVYYYNDDCDIKFYGVLHGIGFFFNEDVVVDDDAFGYIMHGDEVVDKHEVLEKGETVTTVFLAYDELKLPKGASYRFVIPSRFVRLASNEQITADSLAIEFEVPERFEGSSGIDAEIYTGKTLRSFTFRFKVESYPFDDAKAVLSREGKPIMEFRVNREASISDWGLGRAVFEFGRDLHFENNVMYTMTLPEGSVRNSERDDIVNSEVSQIIRGAYGKTLPPIKYTATNVGNYDGAQSVGKVMVDYAEQVATCPDATIQLLDSDGALVCEKSATVSACESGCRVTADFDDTPLVNGHEYYICIPEATVVGTGSDITINQRELIPITGGTSAVGNIDMDNGSGVVRVYSADGVRLNRMQKGLNIVRRDDGKAVKVVK